ncbi:MAG: NAD(P)/FAD-dependent oxidoreductase [Clostridia bacterium]|nr:NAD(P)/FAD-dependent oxidoreductase [Clostridia bacterium]
MKIAVIGGGAAGMFASAFASTKQGVQVDLFEKNEKLGKKIYITGKGRCNFTNVCDVKTFCENVVSNPKFVYGSLYKFTPNDVLNFFENNGLKYKVERGNRAFPLSDKASDVTKTLERVLNKNGVNIHLNTPVLSVEYQDNGVLLTTMSDIIHFDKVIIATGGLSYPTTGSTGDGHKWAKKLGLNTIDCVASLCELKTKQNFSSLAGISLKNVTLSAKLPKVKKQVELFGEMLFTHQGISGPIVLSMSAKVNRCHFPLDMNLDLKPALTDEQLNQRLLRDFSANSNKDIINYLPELLPSGMCKTVAKVAKIEENKKIHQITAVERQRLINALKQFPITVTGLADIEQAIVTAGGIDVKEINPATMQCKKFPNVYFAGEILDVDAMTGGFNLQIAFATGRLAGLSALETD